MGRNPALAFWKAKTIAILTELTQKYPEHKLELNKAFYLVDKANKFNIHSVIIDLRKLLSFLTEEELGKIIPDSETIEEIFKGE